MKTAKITGWVERFVATLADDEIYLVDVIWSKKSNKLEVFIESDGDLTLGNVQMISRKMQVALDESKLIGDDYRLDVSSPGIERPLKLRRQYVKNINRVVDLTLMDDTRWIAKLIGVNDQGIIIKQEIRGPKNKKPSYGKDTPINWKEIKQTIVQIRF